MTTYAKLQDTFPENPKVAGLSDGAFRLYVSALCYAAKNQTDGYVPRAMLKRFGGTVARATELFDAKLWECPVEFEGWLIHDYLKHQSSREEITSKRLARGIAGAKGAASRWHGHRNAQITDDRTQNTETEVLSSSSSARSARQWWEHVTGWKLVDRAVREQVDEETRGHPPECIEWAFKAGIGKVEPWGYTRAILKSCATENHGPRSRNGTGKQSVRAHSKASADDPW